MSSGSASPVESNKTGAVSGLYSISPIGSFSSGDISSFYISWLANSSGYYTSLTIN